MRKHATWMSQLDDRVLELLRDEGPLREWQIRHRLAEAGVDMQYPARYLNFRCATLRNHGLIEENRDGRYGLTSRGSSYLSGRFDASNIERSNEPEDPSGGDSEEFIV